jgi:hypothetical protein
MNLKNFSVFHTFYSHLCSYRIETWYKSCMLHFMFRCYWIFFSELNRLVSEKSLNLKVFWIFAPITLKFGLSFCSKELQFKFAFQWDWFILFCTEIDGPRLRCSCFSLLWGPFNWGKIATKQEIWEISFCIIYSGSNQIKAQCFLSWLSWNYW